MDIPIFPPLCRFVAENSRPPDKKILKPKKLKDNALF